MLTGKLDGDCGCSEAGARNRGAVLDRCGLSLASLVCVRQVHGAQVYAVSRRDAGKGACCLETAPASADALITSERGIVLGVTVADCVPVYLYSPKSASTGLIHAGREGTYQRICQHAVEAMRAHFECPPGDLRAIIGPSAGPCCYEVSDEIAERFRSEGYSVRGNRLDLWETNRQQLLASGVAPDRIFTSAQCTICSDRFFSFRSSKTGHRNFAVLAL